MIEVPLTKGYVAQIDDEDAWALEGGKWVVIIAPHTVYASRHKAGSGKYGRSEKLHQVLLGPVDGTIDHIDGNGLNNRRCNLRICTASQNSQNRAKPKHSVGQFKGAYKHANKWAAVIHIAGKQKYIGLFDSEIQAARAYDEAAVTHFGEYAKLNLSKERDWLVI